MRRFYFSKLFKRTKKDTKPRNTTPYDEETQHYVRRPNFYAGEAIPAHLSKAIFAAGCFWGTEKSFWRLPGVYSTAVVYVNGHKDEPTYREVCTGRTGHAEATLVYFDPGEISLADLLRNFWRCHDPTQGNGQGNDRGTQYRSGVYLFTDDDVAVATASAAVFNPVLRTANFGEITTEIVKNPTFWLAETYHQQYLAKPRNRQYCSAEPTGQELPEFVSWGLSPEIVVQYAPKLPSAFWKTFDGSIKAPHTLVDSNDFMYNNVY